MEEKEIFLQEAKNNIIVEKKYYPDGKIWCIESRFNSLLHGKQLIFSRDGQLYSEVIYENGQLIAIEKSIYDQ